MTTTTAPHFQTAHLDPPRTLLRESADGAGYLAFYDTSSRLAFAWSGMTYRPVEVSYGGAGEPVSSLFVIRQADLERVAAAADADRRPGVGNPDGPLAWWMMPRVFAELCREWIAEQESLDTDGGE